MPEFVGVSGKIQKDLPPNPIVNVVLNYSDNKNEDPENYITELVKKKLGLFITTPKLDNMQHTISFGVTSGNHSLNRDEVKNTLNDYIKMNPSRLNMKIVQIT